MIIEHLVVAIPEGTKDHFLDADAAIWTATLSAQPGFLGKETWIEATNPARIHLIIRWRSRADWHAVPKTLLADTDARMAAAFGSAVPVVSCLDLEVIG